MLPFLLGELSLKLSHAKVFQSTPILTTKFIQKLTHIDLLNSENNNSNNNNTEKMPAQAYFFLSLQNILKHLLF